MVADEASLMESLSGLKVSVAIVDLAVTPGDGLQMVGRVRRQFPDLKTIITGVYDEPKYARPVLEAGADAFVVKRTMATDLLQPSTPCLADKAS